MTTKVDIVMSVLDRERFLAATLEAFAAQTHEDWRLWVRDDGSRDGSVEIVRDWARRDERVRLIHVGGPRLGAAGAYGWLLERVPADARYVFTADADDVWLPQKIERSLDAMLSAERSNGASTPILVHTDLVVVDETLQVIHQSFWELMAFDPEPAALRRQMVRNLVSGPTLLMNRALVDVIGPAPSAARFQDPWYGLVATALGRVVAVREATVLYRQHGSNAMGARDRRSSIRRLPEAIADGLQGGRRFRADLAHSAAMARAMLDRYGPILCEPDRALLSGLAELPGKPFLTRKRDLLRYRVQPEEGVLHTLGVLLRG